MRPSRFLVVILIFLSASIIAPASGGQTVKTIHSFDGADGQNPHLMILSQGHDGALYGTTYDEGAYGTGTVFRLTLQGQITVLHNFQDNDGAYPIGGVTLTPSGSFFGTTQAGGVYGRGVLYEITPTGVQSVLHTFGSIVGDGQDPYAPPIEAEDGNLYGTGAWFYLDDGTVYKYTPSGTYSIIYNFAENTGPETGLLQTPDGNLYTTTYGGGTFGCGSVVKLTTAGTLLWTYSFACGGPFAYGPVGGSLVQASDGYIYGTTPYFGTYNGGSIFRTDPNGNVTFVHAFGSTPGDGLQPYGGLVVGTDGNLYGTTSAGGHTGSGTIFQLGPNGTYRLLYTFPGSSQPQSPVAPPMQHTNGIFYGATNSGGFHGLGSVYSLDMGLAPFIAFVRSTGKVGQSVQILGQGLTGATSVTFNGVPATRFQIGADTFMTAVVPSGATTGKVVVTTPGGALTSNVSFRVVN